MLTIHDGDGPRAVAGDIHGHPGVVLYDSAGNELGGSSGGPVTIADGDDEAQGAKADAAVTDPSLSASEIALLKGLLTVLGQTGDASVAAGAAGSLAAKLRRATQGIEELKSLIVLAAGANVVGKVGIDQTTPGTTDSVTVATGQGAGATIGAAADAAATAGGTGSLSAKLRAISRDLVANIVLAAGAARIGKITVRNAADSADIDPLSESDFDAKIGSLTETAPASDTASSGVNGRLQRIAQRLTSLIGVFGTGSSAVQTQGTAATGSAPAGNPLYVGGSDGTNMRGLQVQSSSALNLRTAIYDGSNIAGIETNPGDGKGLFSALRIYAYNTRYNGSGVDLVRGVLAATLLASSARTATANSADQTNYNHRGLLLTVSVSSAGTGSITPSIQVKDSVSGNYATIWTAAAALTSNGTYVYALAGGVDAASYTEVKQLLLGRTWRLVMTHNNANTITYSASADMVL